MHKPKDNRWVILLVAGLLTSSGSTWADVIDPFDYFSVYSLGDIGTSSNRFQATFQGPTGAAGDAYFRSSEIQPFSTNGYTLHVGGSMSAQYTTTFGGKVEAAGNIGMNGVTISSDLHAGGNISDYGWSGAAISGSAYAGGTVNFSDRVSVQATYSNAAYTPQVDHAAVSAYYLNTSSHIGNLAATGSVLGTGGLVFNAVSGINVVEIDQATLKNAWSFTINAPEDAIVLINVLNASVTLDNTTWTYAGGIGQESVILNMPNASSLALSATNNVNILAPLANTTFGQGNIEGLLVVGNLNGGGYVSGGSFNAHAIPDPATLFLLSLGGLVLMGRRG